MLIERVRNKCAGNGYAADPSQNHAHGIPRIYIYKRYGDPQLVFVPHWDFNIYIYI